MTPAILVVLMVLIGADIRRKDTTLNIPAVSEKKPCYGYTIIEFGKGINCNGDTVKLVKVHNGGQELIKDGQEPS